MFIINHVIHRLRSDKSYHHHRPFNLVQILPYLRPVGFLYKNFSYAYTNPTFDCEKLLHYSVSVFVKTRLCTRLTKFLKKFQSTPI